MKFKNAKELDENGIIPNLHKARCCINCRNGEWEDDDDIGFVHCTYHNYEEITSSGTIRRIGQRREIGDVCDAFKMKELKRLKMEKRYD